MGWMGDGKFKVYKNVDFKDGAEGFEVIAGAYSDYVYIDIRLDSLKGKSIGICEVPPTGDWDDFTSVSCMIDKTCGIHDIYLVFKTYGGINVNSFRALKKAPKLNIDTKIIDYEYIPLDSSIVQRDNESDTWSAFDGLKRHIATNKEAGNPKKNKYVGMFYFIAQQKQAGDIYDNTKILKKNIENPQYGPEESPHYWGEPYLGYYLSQDEYVIRKHAEMLSDAGVDTIILDISNGILFEPTWMKVFKVFYDIRREGGNTPYIMFHCGIDADRAQKLVPALYDKLYSKKLYKELWFIWDSKPLVLGDNSTLDDSLKNFFSFRKSWAWTDSWADPAGPSYWFGDGKDRWPWLDNYPQKYGWHDNKNKPEEISVCAAQHATTNIGRSFHNGSQPDNVTLDITLMGLNFEEQWKRALEINPDFIFVTGWNEWTASRYLAKNGDKFLGNKLKAGDSFFVDEYNEEYSRDIEPERGALLDNYYYQLVNYIRMFKGVRPVLKSKVKKTININYNFNQWNSIKNEYKDTLNDTIHRNTMSFANKINYVNNTGRNDFDVMKVTSDNENLYFYARTKDAITPPEKNNWMMLLINSDNDDNTGWEGYDFVVNHDIKDISTGYLEKNSGGWKWEKVCEIPFVIKNNEIHFAVSKEKIGINLNVPITFKFKWADNVPDDGDIMKFIDNGDVAPNGRFSYVYSEE